MVAEIHFCQLLEEVEEKIKRRWYLFNIGDKIAEYIWALGMID
jgi:hypothetical protein